MKLNMKWLLEQKSDIRTRKVAPQECVQWN